MSIFGKVTDGRKLPTALQGSKLLTTGLQDAIRSQATVTFMSMFGLILGAFFGAWLAGFLPLIWGSVTFSAPGQGLLGILTWLSRGIGVAMSAVFLSSFFRHVTYTIVAKSLNSLKNNPSASEKERVWVDFELAMMAKALHNSTWNKSLSDDFLRIAVSFCWLVVVFFSFVPGGLTSDELGPWMLKAFVFFLVFMVGWRLLYSAPSGMSVEAPSTKLAQVFGREISFKPLLTHDTGFSSSLLNKMMSLFVVGGALVLSTHMLGYSLRKAAQAEAIATQVDQFADRFKTISGEERVQALTELAESQYAGKELQWALFETIQDRAPFKKKDCNILANLADQSKAIDGSLAGVWICSRSGSAILSFKKLFNDQLQSSEWSRFIIKSR